jgi:hypothetical protein
MRHSRTPPEPVAATSLYRLLLGPDFAALAPMLRQVHGKHAYLRGTVTVTRGRSLVARVLAGISGMPRSCADAPCEVSIGPEPGTRDGTERWVRDMAGTRFSSLLLPAGPGEFDESFGWYRLRFRIEAHGAGVRFVLRGFHVFGVPVPRFLHPRIATLESESDGAYAFSVEAALPLLGMVIAYRGLLRPV